jgi:hypothetical protein
VQGRQAETGGHRGRQPGHGGAVVVAQAPGQALALHSAVASKSQELGARERGGVSVVAAVLVVAAREHPSTARQGAGVSGRGHHSRRQRRHRGESRGGQVEGRGCSNSGGGRSES